MKQKLYSVFILCWCFVLPSVIFSQTYDCADLQVSYTTVESRCSATGSITVTVTGGSGNYNYKAVGPISTVFTSSNIISGLPAGTYSVIVEDIVSGCSREVTGAVVAGSYTSPGFTLSNTDVTCINGNDGTITAVGLTNGRAPFQFTIIAPSAMGVGTTNSSGVFTNLIPGSYRIELRDSCGGIQTRNISVQNYDWLIEASSLTRIVCDSGSVSITLRDNKGNTNIAPSTAFNGFTYGVVRAVGDTVWSTSPQFNFYLGNKRAVTIVIKDRCGIIKTINWVDNNKPAVAATVTLSNLACTDFRATVTGQVNLTNPQFCLYNSANVLIACNGGGVFNNIPYGSYCIRITDNCYDTTIIRCFTQNRLVPSLGAVTTSGFTCSTFSTSFSATAQTNLSNPQFCLYNSANILVSCNTTGTFNNIPLGSYCIRMQNNAACYDTIIERCFNVPRPVPAVGANVTISNRACSTFRATVGGQTNLNNPQYCLYNSANVLITCNTTGIFNNLAYGSYCISIINDPACYDTTINRCFTVTKNKPSVSSAVDIGNETCTTFRARIKGQANLFNPQYCLYNNANVLISCNTNGEFENLPYGSYCIRIINDPACYDTTIVRCFTQQLDTDLDMSISTHSLCSNGMSEMHPEFDGGIQPYTIQVYKPGGILVYSSLPEYTDYFTVQLPDLPTGLRYKIVGTDACGNKDSVEIDPFARTVNKSGSTVLKCPGGSWPNGYGDIVVNCSTDEGSIKPTIIKKNNTNVLVNYTVSSGNQFTFTNLEPATYVVRYNYTYTYPWAEVCDNSVYDTITVAPYVYPSLGQSTAYQCDNSSFSVGAAVTGGVAPYTYEIIGSIPTSPSLISAAQNTPVFTINNGASYSLVRLRSIDACGNAALNDVSILPLENLYITTSSNCYYSNVTLSVNQIPNATYTWYKKTSATDSVVVSTNRTYTIPYLLPSDTAMYVCRTSVNTGCLTRLNYRRINGACSNILSNDGITLQGKKEGNVVDLNWAKPASLQIGEYIIERSTSANGTYVQLGTVAVSAAASTYHFTDTDPGNGMLYYRLRIKYTNGSVHYSNIVNLKFDNGSAIKIYPNPVRTQTLISFGNTQLTQYKIELYSPAGQLLLQKQVVAQKNGSYTLMRERTFASGLYVLKLTDTRTGFTSSEMMRFE
jgi:hypothetical protein